MNRGLTRRDFVRFSALGVVGVGCSAVAPPTAAVRISLDDAIDAELVPVRVADVVESKRDDYGIIVLLDDDERYLPIWVGRFEAQSIRVGLNGISTPRPMTYDFIRNLLEATGAVPVRVTITQLRELTFYANLEVERAGTRQSLDCRPSDAIAVAVRTSTPIYVEKGVMESQSVPREALERLEPPLWA